MTLNDPKDTQKHLDHKPVRNRTGSAFHWLSLDVLHEPHLIMEEPLAVLFAICACLFLCVCACESQVCAAPNLGCVPAYVYIYRAN